MSTYGRSPEQQIVDMVAHPGVRVSKSYLGVIKIIQKETIDPFFPDFTFDELAHQVFDAAEALGLKVLSAWKGPTSKGRITMFYSVGYPVYSNNSSK